MCGVVGRLYNIDKYRRVIIIFQQRVKWSNKYSLKAVDLLLLLAGVGILLESYGSLVLVKFEIKVKCWKK